MFVLMIKICFRFRVFEYALLSLLFPFPVGFVLLLDAHL